jgi:hypothetical protein
MTKLMIAAVAAVAALSACAPQRTGPSAAETRLATKIVDAGGVIPLDANTAKQIAGQHAQQMMFQENLSPEQSQQLMLGISKNLEGDMPKIKEGMIAALTEEFNVKELDLLLKFLTSKEGMAIQEKMSVVGQKSTEVADAVTTAAANKALAELKAAWPVAPAAGAPAAPAAPATPGKTN